jgi:hypothetical protein
MPFHSNPSAPTTRCDLHLHSDASLTTGQWFSRYFSAPESYADPLRQYDLCKSRGMTLVTLTDHDGIEGGLRLLDRPDFFLSVEVSTRFPDTGCAIHVLVWNVTPSQHHELQRLRDNIYDVTAYLRQQGLAHGLPHPLLGPNWKLDGATLEKCLVLFPAVEARNGLLDRRGDADVAHLLNAVTPEVLAMLAEKRGIALVHGSPARLALTAGSDDHGHRRSGTIFTEADGDLDAGAYLTRVMAGNTRLVGRGGDLNTMAVCIQQTTYEYFRRRSDGAPGRRNPFVDVMDVLAGRIPGSDADAPRGASVLLEGLIRAAQRAAATTGRHLDIAHVPERGNDESTGRSSKRWLAPAMNSPARPSRHWVARRSRSMCMVSSLNGRTSPARSGSPPHCSSPRTISRGRTFWRRSNVLRSGSAFAHAYIASPRLLDWLHEHPRGAPDAKRLRLVGKALDAAYALLPGTDVLFPTIATQRLSASDNFAVSHKKNTKLKHLITHSRHREWLLSTASRSGIPGGHRCDTMINGVITRRVLDQVGEDYNCTGRRDFLSEECNDVYAQDGYGNTRCSEEILQMVQYLNLCEGFTIIVVTHDPAVARHAPRIVAIKDGLGEDGASAASATDGNTAAAAEVPA